VPASGATSLVYTTPDAGSWKLTAFDIDGKATTKASTDHCALVAGAIPSDVMDDGPGGVDNSFGKNVAPIFTALDSSFFEVSNQAITSGGDTLAFVPLAPGGAPSSFPVALFQANGANILNPDTWKAHASEVASVSPLLVGAKFPAATKVGAAFTSGVTGDVVHLPLVFGGMSMRLDVHGARMTLTYAPDGTTKGVLGGWLETSVFTAEFKKLAGTISSAFCSGSALQGVTAQLEQASDILSDGTQAPEKTCDAITIGIGITTKPGTVDGVFTPAPATDPCAAE